MKAGIGVDDWKLPVFRRRLTEAGFEYTDAGPITGETTMLHVVTDDLDLLKRTLEAAQAECRETGKPGS